MKEIAKILSLLENSVIKEALPKKMAGKKVMPKQTAAQPAKRTGPVVKKLTVITDDYEKFKKLIGTEDPYELLSDSMGQFFTERMQGESVKLDTAWGPCLMKPFYNSRIANFIDNQVPGSVDLSVPLAGKVGDVVLIFIGDGVSGNTLLIYPAAMYSKAAACAKIIEITNMDEGGDDSDDDF